MDSRGRSTYLVGEMPRTNETRGRLRPAPRLLAAACAFLGALAGCGEDVARNGGHPSWTDLGLGDFELRYIRDKAKREVDFAVIRDGEVWILVEVKAGDRPLSPSLAHFQKQTDAKFALQIGLTHWLLSRVGSRRTAMLLPTGLLAGAGFTLAIPGLAVIFGARLWDATMRASLTRSATEFLYFPLPANIRARAKRLMSSRHRMP